MEPPRNRRASRARAPARRRPLDAERRALRPREPREATEVPNQPAWRRYARDREGGKTVSSDAQRAGTAQLYVCVSAFRPLAPGSTGRAAKGVADRAGAPLGVRADGHGAVEPDPRLHRAAA